MKCPISCTVLVMVNSFCWPEADETRHVPRLTHMELPPLSLVTWRLGALRSRRNIAYALIIYHPWMYATLNVFLGHGLWLLMLVNSWHITLLPMFVSVFKSFQVDCIFIEFRHSEVCFRSRPQKMDAQIFHVINYDKIKCLTPIRWTKDQLE